ncbi:hypothetical protein CVT26_005111 [Gymnopilus dilepis]|uniref:F-box domain-containing protein n=1 Tax=Gymnopilus dilepis TaxID=231916 RepID=A0A409W872_9AGAR|nr:hypothetical protein CVT26_005111 [Gymnopilus dilepis]
MPPLALSTPSILELIFDSVLHEAVILPPSPTGHIIPLSGVCQLWRRILLSEPERWRAFIFLPSKFINTSGCLDILKAMISRSSGRLLSFTFEGRANHLVAHPIANLFGGGRIDIVQEIVRPHQDWVSHLKCVLSGEECDKFFGQLNSVEFKVLYTLDLSLHNWYSGSTTHDALSLYKLKWPLCRVTVSLGPGVKFYPLDFQFPLNQLTKLHLEGQSMLLTKQEFLHVMRLCQKTMVDLSVIVEFDYRCKSPAYGPMIRMESLKIFRVRALNVFFDRAPLMQFALPVMESFRMETNGAGIWPWDFKFCEAFLRSSASSLANLILLDIPSSFKPYMLPHRRFTQRATDREDLKSFLRLFSKLHHLTLPSSVQVDDETMSMIASGHFLPFLQAFGFGTRDPRTAFDLIVKRNRGESEVPSTMNCQLPRPILRLSLALPTPEVCDVDQVQCNLARLSDKCHFEFHVTLVQPCAVCGAHCAVGS